VNNKKEEQKNKNLWLYIATSVLILVVLIGIAIWYTTTSKADKDEKTLAYTDLIKELSYGNIEKIEMIVGSTTLKVKQKNEEEEKTAIVPNTEIFLGLDQDKLAKGKER